MGPSSAAISAGVPRTFAEIRMPVAAEMERFEQRFRQAMSSKVALLDRVMHYIVQRKGKQMRPLFTLLSARQFGPVNEAGYTAASLIELLHTATLVHDDVVDDSHMRRGFFSINALWKNKIAVLVGDYLLSKGLLLSVEQGQFELLRIVSTAVREMSEGELLQMEKARGLNFSEQVYFDIIRKKTASLIAACCASGAHAGGADPAQVALMHDFGVHAGTAFQIKDDLFDYGAGRDLGKPTGIDIKEGKLTLPLIHALQQVDAKDRRWMVRTVKDHASDNKAVARLVAKVVEAGGIAHARARMYEQRDQALALLRQLPANEARLALEGLLELTVEREK
ncbi:MAG: polyprenyl synthetase family protein [Flavobacteriales bacterium]|nr:polyprenyl synthetase family protein [Flavobacteriales bacterium]MCL4281876.1 polyprenyl synthetase family protein [Flavobacteriales bacterium]